MPCCWQQNECSFKLVFEGSQVRHDLAFNTGYTDKEEIENSITFRKACSCVCMYSANYWKKNADIYKNYLPLELGCQTINFIEEANDILIRANSSLDDRLKAQLLALKFNIAHYGVADYQYTGGKTLADAALQADNLLCAENLPSKKEIKKMIGLLQQLNCQCFWYCPAELAENNESLGQPQCGFEQFGEEESDLDADDTEYLEGIDIDVEGQPLFENTAGNTAVEEESSDVDLAAESEDILENETDFDPAVELSDEEEVIPDLESETDLDDILDTQQLISELQQEAEEISQNIEETILELEGVMQENVVEVDIPMPQLPQSDSQDTPIELPAQPEPLKLQNEDAIIKEAVANLADNLDNEI
jgi:hypothetical protein